MVDSKVLVIAGLVIATVFAFSLYPSDSAVPPTNSIVNIGTNDTYVSTGGWVNATNYKGTIYFVTDGSVIVEPIPYTGGAE